MNIGISRINFLLLKTCNNHINHICSFMNNSLRCIDVDAMKAITEQIYKIPSVYYVITSWVCLARVERYYPKVLYHVARYYLPLSRTLHKVALSTPDHVISSVPITRQRIMWRYNKLSYVMFLDAEFYKGNQHNIFLH